MVEKSKPHDILSNESEQRMRNGFIRASSEILNSQDRFIKNDDNPKMGIEVEYSLVSQEYSQIPEATRNKIIEENSSACDVELGASQIEYRTDPFNLLGGGLRNLYSALASTDEKLQQSSTNHNIRIMRSGVNPLIRINEIVRTDKPKYRMVPNFHNENKEPGMDTRIGIPPNLVDTADAAVIALCNSVQQNVEAKDFDDAVDKLNRSFMISPYITALSVNARYIDIKDTGYADLRNIAWEVSHDTRTREEKKNNKPTRVGMPSNYYKDLADYFDQIQAYPFILDAEEAAVPIGVGLNWRDARIKFMNDNKDLVVEFRPLSTQTTIEESFAVSLFYLGRLGWSQKTGESLIPFDLVRANKNEVMINGVNGDLFYQDQGRIMKAKSRDVVRNELNRARLGMRLLNLEESDYSYFFDLLESRLTDGTPVEQFTSAVQKYKNPSLSQENHLQENLIYALNDLGVLK